MANLLSLIGSQISRLGLLLYLFHRTDDVVVLAGIIAFETLPGLLVAPVAGALVDRHNKRRVMVCADLLRMAFVLVIILYPSTWVIYGMAGLHSMATAFFSPAKCASIPSLVKTTDLPRANGLDQAANHIILLTGPLIGAELYIRMGLVPALLLDALTFLVSAGLLMRVRVREAGGEPRPRASTISEIGNGWRYLARHTLASHIVLLFFVSLLCVGMWLPLAPYFIRDFLESSDRVLGIKLALFGVGGVVGSSLAPRLMGRAGKGNVLFAALLIEGLIMTVYSTVPTVGLSLFICSLWGVDVAFILVAYYSIIQQTVREDFLGRVFSIVKQSEDVATLLALALAVFLHYFLSVNRIFLAAGATYFLFVAASAGTHGGREMLRIR